MNSAWRRAVTMTAAASLALVGCGKTVATEPSAASEAPSAQKGFAVGLVLPDTLRPRYESFDHPLIEKGIKALCPRCTVDYQNAGGSQSTQQQQIDKLIDDGVKVIILYPVDGQSIEPSVRKAHNKGVKIVAYDELAQGPVDAFVSFDNARIGRQQGAALLDAMGSKATASSRIIMLDGDKTDSSAAQLKAGAHSALDGKVTIAAEYDTKGWQPAEAARETTQALARLGNDSISAVYAANDRMATGVVDALENAHVSPLPPVGGQGAGLDALRRIVAGTQAFTIYKPYALEASMAAQLAIAAATGTPLDAADTTVNSATTRGIPARLISTTLMDAKNIRQTAVDSGLYSIDQICTPAYADACASISLKR